MMIWRAHIKISSVLISKDISQTSVFRRCTESLNASRFKNIYPLTLTFCDKVKHVQLTFSFKSELVIKGLFIQAQNGPFQLICHVLHSKPKKEGPYILCKLSSISNRYLSTRAKQVSCNSPIFPLLTCTDVQQGGRGYGLCCTLLLILFCFVY